VYNFATGIKIIPKKNDLGLDKTVKPVIIRIIGLFSVPAPLNRFAAISGVFLLAFWHPPRLTQYKWGMFRFRAE
jgi:hypothetical protein